MPAGSGLGEVEVLLRKGKASRREPPAQVGRADIDSFPRQVVQHGSRDGAGELCLVKTWP